jgi:hypothetical protein
MVEEVGVGDKDLLLDAILILIAADEVDNVATEVITSGGELRVRDADALVNLHEVVKTSIIGEGAEEVAIADIIRAADFKVQVTETHEPCDLVLRGGVGTVQQAELESAIGNVRACVIHLLVKVPKALGGAMGNLDQVTIEALDGSSDGLSDATKHDCVHGFKFCDPE